MTPVEIIQAEIDKLPPDEAYLPRFECDPGIAYELGRKDGLRVAQMLFEKEVV